MNSKLLIAGAATALLIGGVAIAQTTQQSGMPAPASPTGATSAAQGGQPDRSMTDQMDQSRTDRSMSGDVTAPAAGTYGSDTATTADDQSMRMAGERG